MLEVAARLGGGHDAELVHAATGVDLNALALAAALGEPLAAAEVARVYARRVGGAVTRFLAAPPGELASVEVPQGLNGVVQVRIYREPRPCVRPASPRIRSRRSRAGRRREP